MTDATKRLSCRSALLAGLAFVYFLLFPEDLGEIAAGLEGFLKLVRSVLELTTAISPALYGVTATMIMGWAATDVTRRILRGRAERTAAGEQGAGNGP